MAPFQSVQPQLHLEPRVIKAVVIVALCHNLGRELFSRVFLGFAHTLDNGWAPFLCQSTFSGTL
jgi:hypothetical protein